MKLEITTKNVLTGETTVREMTQEEIKEYELQNAHLTGVKDE